MGAAATGSGVGRAVRTSRVGKIEAMSAKFRVWSTPRNSVAMNTMRRSLRPWVAPTSS